MTLESAVRALELANARAEVLQDALSALVRVMAEIGGYLRPEHQIALAGAVDALGVKPRTKTWRDR